MTGENDSRSPVEKALAAQRQESEARAIWIDLEGLKTISKERKGRWVWELLQNAKDVAHPEGVDVKYILTNDSFSLEHNGKPFSLNEILALIRRTSTKSSENNTTSTGKFGTGFVTSHVLNRVVKVSGNLLNSEELLVPFTITIDRSPDKIEDIMQNLERSFMELDEFYIKPPNRGTIQNITRYEYSLNNHSYKIAKDSLEELKNNLPFSLLINKVKIKSVTIELPNYSKKFTCGEPIPVLEGVEYVPLEDNSSKGLIVTEYQSLIIGLPVIKVNDEFSVIKINENQAKIYKDFPLIGTENFNFPFFIQSGAFLPSEQRDGIRTVKEEEDIEDNIADNNRGLLIQYQDGFYNLFKLLFDSGFHNLHLLCESGLPVETTGYTSMDWYIENIQKPIRKFLLGFPIVDTPFNKKKSIGESKIPIKFLQPEINLEFYKICSEYFCETAPSSTTYESWQTILEKQPENWGVNLFVTINDLAEEISKISTIEGIESAGIKDPIKWLDSFIYFIHRIGNSVIAEKYSLYPDQTGILRKKPDVYVDPGLNSRIKVIGNNLGILVSQQLLDKKLIFTEGIKEFDCKGLFDTLNITIGNMVPESNEMHQYKEVLILVGIFSKSPAPEREKWYELTRELLPHLTIEKEIVDDISDFKWAPAEKASIKYVCWLIQKSDTFSNFTNNYFASDTVKAYTWLNKFYEVLFRKDEYEEFLRAYRIVPTQDDYFKKYDNIYCEEEPFDDNFKTLYKEVIGTDSRTFLIDLNIRHSKLERKREIIITQEIDNIFSEQDAENQVAIESKHRQCFLKLYEWIGNKESTASRLFPVFLSKSPQLYVRAFSSPELSKMVMVIHKSKKSIAEIEAITKLTLPAAELRLLEKAAEQLGGTNVLLQLAQIAIDSSNEAIWKKGVGTAAEQAFLDAISEICVIFPLQIENPDNGYDFEIALKSDTTKKYLVEIKSILNQNSSIKMTSKQGATARDEKSHYALCVLSREGAENSLDKDFFVKNAKFTLNIGELVKDKVDGMESEINELQKLKSGDINAALENERYTVHVTKDAWNSGVPFDDFVSEIKKYFGL